MCCLSPLAVAPPYQRQGIGSALVRSAVEACDRMGEPLVVLEGSPEYYGRLGFEHAVPHGITHRTSPTGRPPRPPRCACSHVRPCVSREVVYPPAFAGVSADGRGA